MAQTSVSRPRAETLVNDFVRSVYNWMAIGLGLTAVVALYVSGNEALTRLIFGNSMIFILLIVAELGLVFAISGMVQKMSAGTATFLFVLYSALNGVTLSFIFLAYTQTSIVSTFFVLCRYLCGVQYLWLDHQKGPDQHGRVPDDGFDWHHHCVSGEHVFQKPGMSMVISYIGVIVFVGLTAYDTQKLKNMALTQPVDADGSVVRKGAILGALSLYLDFINLFLMLLRIFGQSRD